MTIAITIAWQPKPANQCVQKPFAKQDNNAKSTLNNIESFRSAIKLSTIRTHTHTHTYLLTANIQQRTECIHRAESYLSILSQQFYLFHEIFARFCSVQMRIDELKCRY